MLKKREINVHDPTSDPACLCVHFIYYWRNVLSDTLKYKSLERAHLITDMPKEAFKYYYNMLFS